MRPFSVLRMPSLVLLAFVYASAPSFAQSPADDVYDASGRLVARFDAQKNVAIQYIYDEHGALVREIHSDGTIIEHGADARKTAR